MRIGYCRVSSSGQELASQVEILKKNGVDKIFTEKMSGRQMENRVVLQEALDFVRDGDTFVVTRLDRCSRSVKDLHIILSKLEAKSVSFKATEQELDTATPQGRLLIGILSTISAFQVDLQKELQMDGIRSAQKRGVKFGPQAKFNEEKTIQAIELQNQGQTNQQIADGFEIGRSTLLRYISNYKKLQEAA